MSTDFPACKYWQCPECEEVYMVDALYDLTQCEECLEEVSPKDNEMDELDFWAYCQALKGC